MATIQSSSNAKKRRITFSISAPAAEEVILLGDFNGWDPVKHPMKQDSNGMWKKIVMVPPGRYEYKFLVDGQWQLDPENVQICTNCFGTRNHYISLEAK